MIDFFKKTFIATNGEDKPTFSIILYPAKITPTNLPEEFIIGDPLDPGFVGIV